MSVFSLGGASCTPKPSAGGTSQQNSSPTITSLTYCKRGTMKQPIIYYELTVKDGVATLKNASGRDEEDAISRQVDISIVDSLQQIIAEEKVMKYKSSYTPHFRVLDGYSWYLDIVFSDDTYKMSSGSNAWPDGEGLHRITELFKSQFTKED